MPAKTREQKAADASADASTVAGVPVKSNETVVVNTHGHVVRTYDLATHGKNHAELAAEFAEKFGHTVVAPKKPKAVKPEAEEEVVE